MFTDQEVEHDHHHRRPQYVTVITDPTSPEITTPLTLVILVPLL